MTGFWNDRYSSEEYAYGTKPNLFFSEQIAGLVPGTVLFAAEGEGRNAVFASKLGWDVVAFDQSTEGKRKALKLAEKESVSLDYQVCDFDSVSFPKAYFDCIVLVFVHLQAIKRKNTHQKLTSFLKPGGTLILQGFSKEQLKYSSGGPQDVEMLFSVNELGSDFESFSKLKIWEVIEVLDEGPFHQGMAALINVIGIK